MSNIKEEPRELRVMSLFNDRGGLLGGRPVFDMRPRIVGVNDPLPVPVTSPRQNDGKAEEGKKEEGKASSAQGSAEQSGSDLSKNATPPSLQLESPTNSSPKSSGLSQTTETSASVVKESLQKSLLLPPPGLIQQASSGSHGQPAGNTEPNQGTTSSIQDEDNGPTQQ